MNSETQHILIVDDHQLIIDGLKLMLQKSAYQVLAEANDGEKALQILNTNNSIKLVITDVSMPTMNGIELCKQIKQQYQDIKVLMLSMYDNSSVIKEALDAEADGYILKSTNKAELLQALEKMANGGTYYSQSIMPILLNQFTKQQQTVSEIAKLSDREKEVLVEIAKELTSEEIAIKLFISKKTVDNHRTKILEKTNCKSTVGLVKLAIREGLVSA